MKKNFLILLIFLFVLSIFFIVVFEAYSVRIVLEESSIQPLPIRESIQYFLSKQGSSNVLFAEVRSISLSTSGTTVTSAQITWYRGFRFWFGYYVTVGVTLRDDYGNTVSSGSSGMQCYVGRGSVTINIDLSPDVDIDRVARVETSINIGGLCWEPPFPIEQAESVNESEEE